MKKNVHTKIAFRAHRGGPRGEVLLATNDAQESHLNIYLRPSTRSSADCCIHPDDAKALRDALIEIYPIEAPVAPKPIYEVINTRGGYRVIECRREVKTEDVRRVMGEFTDAEVTQRFVKMLEAGE